MSHAPEMIEMLVANNIVVPDLPANLVYEKVWYPYIYKQRNPDEYIVPPISTVDNSYRTPMDVIYRLAGIDGEATENRVETLQDDDELNADPEKKYALAKTLLHPIDGTEENGVHLLLNDFKKVESIQKDSYLLKRVLPLLKIAVKIHRIMREIIVINGTDVLVDKLFIFLSEQVNEEQQELLDGVIEVLENIVVEGSKLVLEQDMEVDSNKKENRNAVKNVGTIVNKITTACEQMVDQMKNISNTSTQIVAISRILPLLTYEDKEAEGIVADLVLPNIKDLVNGVLNEDNQTNYRWDEKFRVEFYCERFLNFLESAQNSVKQAFTDKGVINELCKYLGETLNSELIENEENLLRYGKPLAIILKSLALYLKSNAPSQSVLLEYNKSHQVIEKIFKLSKTKLKERNLSILAEGVIESVSFESELNDKETHDFVKNLVNAEDAEKKRKADKKRKAMMAKMKKSKNIKKKIKFEEIKEEKGIKCIICQEGYQVADTDLMGVYVFVKRVSMIPDRVIHHNEENGYTTVTHFNSIHFKCHRNAYDADCNRKKALSEWDGAQIRNSHTKCNALFPIKGGNITEDSYRQYINEYLSNLSYNVYQVSQNKTRVMFYDLKLLFKKLAFEESFSKDSHGGGAEHNINFVPFMIHMSLSIMKDNGELLNGKPEESTEKFLTEAITKIEELKKLHQETEEVEEVKMVEEIEEEVKFMNEMEEGEGQDFDAQAKSVNEKLEAWMYWSLVACVMGTDAFWNEKKWQIYEISKVLAKMNSKFLPAPEKIFVLSENTRSKQEACSSKSTINKYANSAKKVIIYFTLLNLLRIKFIKNEPKETLSSFNEIKTHEEVIEMCQEIFHQAYTPMLEKTGEEILKSAFTEEERTSEKFVNFE